MLNEVSTNTISSGWIHHLSRRSVVRAARSPTDPTVATVLMCSSTYLFLELLTADPRHERKRDDG